MPNLGNVTFNKLKVPPYKLLEATIWSPAFKRVNKPVAIAEVPDAKTTAPIPPSTAAKRSCKI